MLLSPPRCGLLNSNPQRRLLQFAGHETPTAAVKKELLVVDWGEMSHGEVCVGPAAPADGLQGKRTAVFFEVLKFKVVCGSGWGGVAFFCRAMLAGLKARVCLLNKKTSVHSKQ